MLMSHFEEVFFRFACKTVAETEEVGFVMQNRSI